MNGRSDPERNSAPPQKLSLSALDVGRFARRSLELELFTWPKPGLVSHLDSGAHQDMDASLIQASAQCLEPFFTQLAAAGAAGATLPALRDIGIAAERAMLEVTCGVNTHRGAIFGLGLLSAAAGRLALEGTLVRKRRATAWAYSRPAGPARNRMLVSATAAISAKHASTRAASSPAPNRRARRRAGSPIR